MRSTDQPRWRAAWDKWLPIEPAPSTLIFMLATVPALRAPGARVFPQAALVALVQAFSFRLPVIITPLVS